MEQTEFQKLFPNVENNILWYLEEIIYCLEHYAGMKKEQGLKVLTTSQNFMRIIDDHPLYITHETAFYWAMCIIHGFDSPWWHDKKINEQQKEYVKNRHNPPS